MSTRSPLAGAAPRVVRERARAVLLVVEAFVAVTALAGGIALIVGSLISATEAPLGLRLDDLRGTPFADYLVPGILLAGGVGGVHVAAFVLAVRRRTWQNTAAAIAGFVLVVWIFVQMVSVPFTPLQAVFFAAGLAEVGLVLLILGLLDAR